MIVCHQGGQESASASPADPWAVARKDVPLCLVKTGSATQSWVTLGVGGGLEQDGIARSLAVNVGVRTAGRQRTGTSRFNSSNQFWMTIALAGRSSPSLTMRNRPSRAIS